MNKLKVLVVDDDEMHLKLVDAMLTSQGYSVDQLKDGKDVLKTARTWKPDIILMDVMMPEVDGYAALGALKGNGDTKSIPVVMISSVGFEMNKKLAGQLGANGYITKPLRLQELLKTMGSLVSPSQR